MFTIKNGIIYTKDPEGNEIVSQKSYNSSECCDVCVLSDRDESSSNPCLLNVMLRKPDIVPVNTINGVIVFKRQGDQLYGVDKVHGRLHLCCDTLAKISGAELIVFKHVKKEEEEVNP